MKTRRPNPDNLEDACCRCGLITKTPSDPDHPKEGELVVWWPDTTQVAQWMCVKCRDVLEGKAVKDPLEA